MARAAAARRSSIGGTAGRNVPGTALLGGEHARRVERRERDERRGDAHRVAEAERQPERVEERQDAVDDLRAGRRAGPRLPLDGVGDEVAVREHRALRRPRGAAGVLQQRDVGRRPVPGERGRAGSHGRPAGATSGTRAAPCRTSPRVPCGRSAPGSRSARRLPRGRSADRSTATTRLAARSAAATRARAARPSPTPARRRRPSRRAGARARRPSTWGCARRRPRRSAGPRRTRRRGSCSSA